MSPRIASEHDVRDYYRERDFDAFIVGSDQVWRPRYSPSILNFYLDFLHDIKSPAKRIAYAASFGVDDWEYSGELTEPGKTHEKPLYDGLRSALPVGANVVI